MRYSHTLTNLLIITDILLLFFTALFSKRNSAFIKNVEEYFSHKNAGTSADRISQFHKLLDENLFHYHFQPIVSSKTGEIFAYEALMRTDPDSINMNPFEILSLAEKENCLYDIERLTFHNTLRAMKEYGDIFQTRKMFINSISSHQLQEEDFGRLYEEYSPLFGNVVCEITEATKLNTESIQTLQKRLSITNCQLALDDYGTGYSNESNLLNTNPHYIKIDKSMLRCIHIDEKKQLLVSNLVEFARQNNIKIIAEGIESYDEFEYVIHLGVDYIQGFYTAKPDPSPVKSLSEEVLTKIKEINYKQAYENAIKEIYISNNESVISPVAIALSRYTDIMINEAEITLKGSQGMSANVSVFIPEHHKCHIILDNVNLHGYEKPSINIGENCTVVLELIGQNYLTCDGIRVPQTSDLTIIGAGSLNLQAERSCRVGIGGTSEQSYGNITLASTGSIKLFCNGNVSVGIGGGKNTANSLIRLLSGHIYIENFGYNSIAIGCISGNARIEITECNLKINSEATRTVSIGCLTGYADIRISADLDLKCDAKYAAAIGVLEDSEGKIVISGGSLHIHFNAYVGVGIGSISGAAEISILDGDIIVSGEGTDILGIGCQCGFGRIIIKNGILSFQLYAANAIPICNIQRNVIIDGGNIQCDFPEDITPVNSYGTPLTAHIITESDEFCHKVDTVSYSYVYKAAYSNRFSFIKVYLPDNIILQ